MPLHIPAVIEDVLVQLSGTPIHTEAIAVTPGAGGIAFDGTYFYLNYYQGKKIYVITPSGTLINTLTTAKVYSDIDYDSMTDEIWAVDAATTGIDRLSKADGSLIANFQNSVITQKYTSIAIDRYNDRLYLLYHALYGLVVTKVSSASLIRIVYFPLMQLGQPSTAMVFLDSVDREKFWVGYYSFPVMLGRIMKDADKIDAYRILGASFNQVKASISIRFLNSKWYYWGDWGSLGRANLYELSGMPPSSAPPALVIPNFDQDIYRWFNNDSAENPTPRAGENTEIDSVSLDEVLRFRLGIKETTGSATPWSSQLKLQYATNPLGPWTDLGAIGATDKAWNYVNGLGDDGSLIANLLLSNTTIKEYFSESSPSNVGLSFRSPDRGEWDFAVTPYFPASLQDYYFRALNIRDDLIKTFSKIPKAITGTINYAWNVRTASYLQVFSIAAQETAPQGVFFKPDGTKMYVIGTTGKDVNEYNLSTPWDVSTASYLQVFSIAAQETFPSGVFFKPDGTKMYVIGYTGDDVNEYNLSTPWNVSTASYLQVFSVAAQETDPMEVFFKPDGTKMYVMGGTGKDVNEYNLSIPWNVSTASYLQVFSVAAQETGPTGVFFKPDGTKMYVIGVTGRDVNEYNLSTPWDVSTASYLQVFSIAAQEASPSGVFFKPDGMKMYVIGYSGDDVNEYNLGIP